MGGFEAGGEGGYWEEDQVARLRAQDDNNAKQNSGIKPSIEKNDDGYSIKAHAKVNIFLDRKSVV